MSIRPISLALLIFLLALPLAGCQPAPMPVQPSQTPPGATLAPVPSSSEALAACPIEEQQQAMRASQMPDWQKLGIFACYQLSLVIHPAATTYAGEENLTYTNLTGTELPDIVFRLYPNAANIYGGKMTITSTQVDGQPADAEVFLSDQTALRIKFASKLTNGKTTRVKIAFTITVPEDLHSDTTYGIFNYSTTGSQLTLANWFPILAVRQDGDWQASPVLLGGDAVTSQTALYTVNIEAPPDWKFATTGQEIHATEKGQSIVHQFVSGPARDFMLTASPSFTSNVVQAGDISIAQWGQPDTSIGWPFALQYARASLNFYDREFGNYPFKELDVVAAPLQYATGVEYPGLILILDNVYNLPVTNGQLEVVIAHEIAHQWWYSVIGNDVLKDPWQDEALATFSSMAYLQNKSSPIYTGMLNQFNANVGAYDLQNPDQSITQPVSAFQKRLSDYSVVVYVKGALFFEDLQKDMGSEKLFESLQNYYRTNQYQLVPPQSLIKAIQETCQCDLSEVEQKYGVPASSP